jgi:surface antigen
MFHVKQSTSSTPLKKKRIIIVSALVMVLLTIIVLLISHKVTTNPNPSMAIGQKVDSLNGVYVYYNGGIGNVKERNTTIDGYNIGLKYQCVEFVKRYYYEHYKHKMPDSYGNAKDFFDRAIQDGKLNRQRDLIQFTNPSQSKPCIGDLVIMDGHSGNPYGHVVIISKVNENAIEIIQQNPGPFAPSRVEFGLDNSDGKWHIDNGRLLGWLRKESV